MAEVRRGGNENGEGEENAPISSSINDLIQAVSSENPSINFSAARVTSSTLS